MEYFIDVDPGVGGATDVPITSGATIDESFIVPTSALPIGFHTLVIRTQDASLAWSLQSSRFFYISQSLLSTTATVLEIEYFIDIDPGYDNGTPLPITTGTTVDFTNVISTSALPAGFHTIYVRALDSDGVWGATEFRSFYISSSDLTTQANIVAMEYFFDTDPGYGSGTSLGISAGPVIDFSTILTTSALAEGFHNIYIRALDVDGTWGNSESRTFFIDGFGNAQIDGIESFVDLDPGYGNGDFIDIVPDADSIDQVVNISMSALPAGNYTVGIRALDTNSTLGQTEFINVTICDGATPDFSALPVCEGATTNFIDLSTNVLGGDTYAWDFDDDTIIDDATIGNTSFTYSSPGSYTATLFIDRAGCTTSFTQLVDVIAMPTADAGLDQSDCLDNSTMNATALVGGETGLWTVNTGTGTFSLDTDPASGITGLSPGINEFQWEVSDATGTCNTIDIVQIEYIVPTLADAGVDQSICSDNTTLAANAPLVGEIGAWSIVVGTGVITTPTDPTSTVTGIITSTIDLQWTITDATGTCSTSDVASLSVNLPITAADANGSAAIGDTLIVDVQSLATINSGDILTTTITGPPTKGTATVLADGRIQFIPNTGILGADNIDFQLCNQCGNCDTGSISLDIPNNAPTITTDTVTVTNVDSKTVSIDLALAVSDINNNADLSTLRIVTQPLSGATATIDASNNLIIDYTGITYSGIDQVSIEVCDDQGVCAVSLVSLLVDVSAEEDPDIIVYNAVTPNGDNKHDFLRIDFITSYPDNQVNIYDKLGNLVFKITGYDNIENRFAGIATEGDERALPNGTYYYVITLNSDKSESGFLVLQN